jgi:large subunit ribosomal protein L7/L12
MRLFRDPEVARLSGQVALLSRQVQRLQELVERLAAHQGIDPPPPMVISTAPVADARAVDAEVLMLVQQGKKIQAIKLVRERTGLGLKEAKDLVEGL